ncbi:MAG: phage tail protein I [Anaerolineales bacterium]|nr:phage tail protein I [Anaerolineales bacterium]
MSQELHVVFKGEIVQKWPIPFGNSTIGTGSDCSLVLANNDMQTIELEHIELRCTATQCEVQDLASLNGTQVNDDMLEAHHFWVLRPHDVIKIGGYKLIYEWVEVETAVSPPSPPEPTVAETAAPPEANPALPAEQQPLPPTDNDSSEPPESPPEPPNFMPPFSQHHSDDDIASRYLQYLPGIYHTPFVTRYLALLESVLAPIEWNIANFDLYLDPHTAPAHFLPWLANWFGMTFDDSWSEPQRRQFLSVAHCIQPRIGTAVALKEILAIYTQVTPTIDDTSDDLPEATFRVQLPLPDRTPLEDQIRQIIDAYKPAFTTYELVFTGDQAA